MYYKCTHRGTFVGRGPRPGTDIDYFVSLHRPFPTAEAVTPVELTFPGDSPLVIEWEDWKPEKAIQGSMLTLKVVSLRDREFIDYYTTQAGEIFIKVYCRERRKGMAWRLMWRGSLDPEFYEEPYEASDGYDVTLTFSDFGTLGRMKFHQFTEYRGDMSLTGMASLEGYLARALQLARIIDDESVWCEHREAVGMVLTGATLSDYRKNKWNLADLGKTGVAFGNFEDEEGEPDTWRDVLESLFMPLGLHMVQRMGRVVVYDTDMLAGDVADQESTPYVHWTSDSQTLGAAETCNEIKLTFSPYARPCLLSHKPEVDRTGLRSEKVVNNALITTLDHSEVEGMVYPSFRIMRTAHATDGTGAAYSFALGEFPYFHIYPIYGNCPECSGYMYTHKPLYVGASNQTTEQLRDLLRLAPVAVPADPGITRTSLLLSMDMLFDPRYNPFESAETNSDGRLSNYAEDWEAYSQRAGWVSVPLRILLRDSAGKVTHYFSNMEVFNRYYGDKPMTVNLHGSSWVRYTEGAEVNGQCWAQWYDDRGDAPALNGWTTNRPTVGIWGWQGDLPPYLSRLPKGMIIPYPPQPGYIEIAVLDGVLVHRRNSYNGSGPFGGWPWYRLGEGSSAYTAPYRPVNAVCESDTLGHDISEITRRCRWIGFKDITLKIVGGADPYSALEAKDELVEGAVDSYAQESLDIDTKCGTVRRPSAGLLGIYWGADSPVYDMTRGTTDFVERRLIASLVSQYTQRRTVLRGEAGMIMSAVPVVYEHNTPGEFIISASTLDAIEGTEEVTLTRLFPDRFDSKPMTNGPSSAPDPDDLLQDDDPGEERDPNDSMPWEPDDIEDYEPFDPGDDPEPWDNYDDPSDLDDGWYDDPDEDYYDDPDYDIHDDY